MKIGIDGQSADTLQVFGTGMSTRRPKGVQENGGILEQIIRNITFLMA